MVRKSIKTIFQRALVNMTCPARTATLPPQAHAAEPPSCDPLDRKTDALWREHHASDDSAAKVYRRLKSRRTMNSPLPHHERCAPCLCCRFQIAVSALAVQRCPVCKSVVNGAAFRALGRHLSLHLQASSDAACPEQAGHAVIAAGLRAPAGVLISSTRAAIQSLNARVFRGCFYRL
jgi:hypothetical protein